MPTPRTLISDSLIECGVIAENQTPGSAEAARALRILNRDIMSAWSVVRAFATTKVITSGTFAASTATRTIGPTGTYVLTPRPIELLQAHWVDSGDLRYPIRIRDEQWYGALVDPELTAEDITDIAYFPTVSNGTMYPWPIPTGAVTVEIMTLAVLAEFADLDTDASFAPGYERAVTQTLKELV